VSRNGLAARSSAASSMRSTTGESLSCHRPGHSAAGRIRRGGCFPQSQHYLALVTSTRCATFSTDSSSSCTRRQSGSRNPGPRAAHRFGCCDTDEAAIVSVQPTAYTIQQESAASIRHHKAYGVAFGSTRYGRRAWHRVRRTCLSTCRFAPRFRCVVRSDRIAVLLEGAG
jgi:hypothetical protein